MNVEGQQRASENADDYAFRFGGLARLFGTKGLERLRGSHVCVVGVGGVGSWVVEALARSGIGALTLVDLDEICVSNINRQLPALNSTVGRAKVEVLAERVRDIHPECRIDARQEFFTESTAASVLSAPYTHVVDAIDAVKNKCLLIAQCLERKLPLTVCGGAGGRRDATRVGMEDLARVTQDRLLAEVRRRLRKEYGFPRGDRKFGIACVCSPEPPIFPRVDGSVCATREPSPEGQSLRLNCDWGFGSAAFVTATFGMVAAGYVVQRIVETEP